MHMIRFVTVNKMAEMSGYSPKAIERKIEEGVWAHGNVWRKAPDGRRLIDVEGYNAWVDSRWVASPRAGKVGVGR